MSKYDKTISYKGFNLPKPSGDKILVEVHSQYLDEGKEAKSLGGIILTQKTAQQEHYGACKATVIAMGLDTYNDVFNRARGCQEPWCEVEDVVLLKAHSGYIIPASDGQEFVHGRFQVVNDEQIVSVYGKETGDRE